MSSKFKNKKVLLLGSGGLRIGQAGEFDYSGSQAIKALKEEGANVILINPNIATKQTDPDMADVLYLQPLNQDSVIAIIEKEKPDAVLLGFGGQTALNLGLALAQRGIFEKYHVDVLGTSVQSIRLAEDRELFRDELKKINIDTPTSIAANNLEQAIHAAKEIGYPIMMRSAFSLGGLGSGKITDEAMLKERVQAVLTRVPQVLIEEYLVGWSELEYEIVRDKAGNTLTICNMENFDPMGVHTGESIVVSPSQTINNDEYHFLRDIAIQVATHFKIIGECNIQYAFNAKTGAYRVIEINPRLSRSSALASKATGYPLAFVATKLALGLCLHEIKNSVTQKTSAFFEPALDYVVVKIPRWDTHKFRTADRHIGTEMKSVGEVMAIGRSFPEALQKAIGMLNIGLHDICDFNETFADPADEIKHPTDRRLFALYAFFKTGGSVEDAVALSGIHPWYLHHIYAIYQIEQALSQALNENTLRQAKKLGVSDHSIARICKKTPEAIRALRQQYDVLPKIKQIDTLAGEFDAQTNYLYLTYHAHEHDLEPSAKQPVIVLGSGPYSIGSSVEFDWCAVTTATTLRQLNEMAIIINSNPETVSTDYDESDRLYFEQLSAERVLDITEFENPKGIVVSVGGQIANNLAVPIAKAGYPILGTRAEDIDRAENRERFSSLLNRLGVDQPAWEAVSSINQAKAFAKRVGYPVLIRPSYVLSGAAMTVVYDDEQLLEYLTAAARVSPDYPTVISQFITGAKELEIDGVADGGEMVIQAISEHIENAGVHSGDATIVLPPQRLYLETIRRTKKITKEIVKALNITGPFNIQFIAKNNEIKVIECNVRASRSFPFVSKVVNHNLIQIATRVLLSCYQKENYETLELDYVGVKTPQFSYSRLKGSNPVAHVEMSSTGEVACLGNDLKQAFYLSWCATELSISTKEIFISIGGDQKPKFLSRIKQLEDKGWEIYTTRGTHDFLSHHGVGSRCVFKASEKVEPNATTLIAEKKVSMLINIPNRNPVLAAKQKTDGFHLRRLAIDHNTPLITNTQIALLMLDCLIELYDAPIPVQSWQTFMGLEVTATHRAQANNKHIKA